MFRYEETKAEGKAVRYVASHMSKHSKTGVKVMLQVWKSDDCLAQMKNLGVCSDNEKPFRGREIRRLVLRRSSAWLRKTYEIDVDKAGKLWDGKGLTGPSFTNESGISSQIGNTH